MPVPGTAALGGDPIRVEGSLRVPLGLGFRV